MTRNRPIPAFALVLAAVLAGCGWAERRDERESAIRVPPPADMVAPAEAGAPNRHAVRAVGGPDEAQAEVEARLLREAAQLTLDTGHDWFQVVTRDVDSTTRFGNAGSGIPAPSFGPVFYGRGYRDQEVATGISEPMTRYVVTAAILVHEGSPPVGEPGAYDARAFLRAEAGAVAVDPARQ